MATSFEWLTAREAVLLRPDAYVGALDAVEEEAHICGESGAETVAYCMSPILMKIFDEVLVNAIDSTTRDSLVSRIACSFEETTGAITVENNGTGIPIEEFKNTGRWIPSVLFSELHAGSNFKDEEARLGGGRNGVGASCTNVWSVLFEVSVADGKKHFFQRFSRNLQSIEEPVIAERRARLGFVKVYFVPDYARLGIDLAANAAVIRKLIRMRCLEAAVCTRSGVELTFEGSALPAKGACFLKTLSGADAAACEEFGQQGDGGCTLWFAQRKSGLDFYGYVNGVRCDGGTLAAHVRERLTKAITDAVKKKHQVSVRAQTLKDAIALLCVARVVNPRFTSQAKTALATGARQLGFSVEPSARMIGKLQKLGIIDEIVRRESERELSASLRKTLAPKSREILVDKYDPALDSRSDPLSCTLILTEGDSAKAFVVAGLSVLGRDKHGVFPLRGVPLNVTNLSLPRILENKEIANIFRILNVGPHGDGKGLRYGQVAICSDQDSDGSHICGLIINLLLTCLPEVVSGRPGFIQRIVTPLIRATHRRHGEQLQFFSMQQFHAWEKTVQCKEWALKYYKGLGTSSSREARDIFRALEEHRVTFVEDAEARGTLLHFYDDAHAAERKRLLTADYNKGAAVDYSLKECTITRFMLAEHLHFSFYSVYRALPSSIDGLTPSRRKVLYYFLSSPRAGEVKVAQAAAGVAQKTLYLHGENSLVETIVALCQDYPGTNNVALLQPLGQFGSRNDKPCVHAAARYIFTKLDPVALALFPAADAAVLEYRAEEGQQVEPVFFVPVIPLLLVNGAQGIGTGFATSIPSYSVPGLCACIRAHLAGEELPEIPPYFEGFAGSIATGDRSVVTTGVVEKTGERCWLISELPVGKWTDPFLTELKSCAEGARPCKGLSIASVRNMSTEFSVRIEVVLGEECQDKSAEDVKRALRLSSSISTSHMYAFNGSYDLTLYASPHEILLEHARVRLDLYWKRRAHQLKDLDLKLRALKGKVAFIELIIKGKLGFTGIPRAELVLQMRASELPAVQTPGDDEGYEYLLNLHVAAFTHEKIASLQEEAHRAQKEYAEVEARDAAAMWLLDLEAVEVAYADYQRRLLQRRTDESEPRAQRSAAKKRGCGSASSSAKKSRAK